MKKLVCLLLILFFVLSFFPLTSTLYHNYLSARFTSQLVDFVEAYADDDFDFESSVVADVGSGSYCGFISVVRLEVTSEAAAVIERFENYDFKPAKSGGRPKIQKDVAIGARTLTLTLTQGSTSSLLDLRCF